jgi:hypothetical protein
VPNDFYTQQALADDARFRKRVKSALGLIAWQVLTEDPGTVGHNGRAAYARTVLQNLDGAAAGVAGWLVMRTNVFSFATSCTIDQGVTTVVTASGDADIQSQLATDWSNLAGV